MWENARKGSNELEVTLQGNPRSDDSKNINKGSTGANKLKLFISNGENENWGLLSFTGYFGAITRRVHSNNKTDKLALV